MVPSFVWDFIVGLGAIGFYTVVFYCLATWLYRNWLLKPLDVQVKKSFRKPYSEVRDAMIFFVGVAEHLREW